MYGKALDAQCDFDGQGGYQRAHDAQLMKEAAVRAGAPAKKIVIYNSHVHARFN